MFSLLDSSVPRRGWTTLLSFALEISVIALLVLIPLLHTQALPALMARIVALPVPPGPPAPREPRPRQDSASQSEVIGDTVLQPIHIPARPAIIHDEQPLQPAQGPGVVGVPTGFGSNVDWRNSPLHEIAAAAAPPLPAAPTRVPVSGGVSQGYLLFQVKPVYPPLARTAHVQGKVVLEAVISRAGAIENLRLLSGHPLLAPAAIDAVRQWRYRPYLLNGAPVEVETQITVNFTLAPGS